MIKNQIERITYYEDLLNRAASALTAMEKATESVAECDDPAAKAAPTTDTIATIQPIINELEVYYASPEWKEDFEASENGELPKDLPCGVLSEDGIYNLLDNFKELKNSQKEEPEAQPKPEVQQPEAQEEPVAGAEQAAAARKRIVVVNAGPRKGWNTDILITEAARGAEEAGAEIIRFDLFQLEKYTGCVSCFGCKKEAHKGHCVVQDGLTPVLDAIRESDGLIVGSPNYLSQLTASFRALYERLIFQSLTYNRETPSCNQREVPVLLIMTSNAPDTAYTSLLSGYKGSFDHFVGPTTVLVSGDTLQLDDYGATDWPWSMFDPEKKKARREEVFPQERQKAYEAGKALAQS